MAVKEEEKVAVSDERQKALKLAIDKSAWGDNVRYVYATDFIKNTAETDPTWRDRVDAVANNEK